MVTRLHGRDCVLHMSPMPPTQKADFLKQSQESSEPSDTTETDAPSATREIKNLKRPRRDHSA